MPVETDPVVRTRSLWIQYDNLKRLLTRLGCTMLQHKHDPRNIDHLCTEMIDAMFELRASYRESLRPGKSYRPRP